MPTSGGGPGSAALREALLTVDSAAALYEVLAADERAEVKFTNVDASFGAARTATTAPTTKSSATQYLLAASPLARAPLEPAHVRVTFGESAIDAVVDNESLGAARRAELDRAVADSGAALGVVNSDWLRNVPMHLWRRNEHVGQQRFKMADGALSEPAPAVDLWLRPGWQGERAAPRWVTLHEMPLTPECPLILGIAQLAAMGGVCVCVSPTGLVSTFPYGGAHQSGNGASQHEPFKGDTDESQANATTDAKVDGSDACPREPFKGDTDESQANATTDAKVDGSDACPRAPFTTQDVPITELLVLHAPMQRTSVPRSTRHQNRRNGTKARREPTTAGDADAGTKARTAPLLHVQASGSEAVANVLTLQFEAGDVEVHGGDELLKWATGTSPTATAFGAGLERELQRDGFDDDATAAFVGSLLVPRLDVDDSDDDDALELAAAFGEPTDTDATFDFESAHAAFADKVRNTPALQGRLDLQQKLIDGFADVKLESKKAPKPTQRPPPISAFVHSIVLKPYADTSKIQVHGRRYRMDQQQIIESQALEWLEDGTLEPVTEAAYTINQTVVAPKYNEARERTGWRLCVDFRRLNELTQAEQYPMPLMDECLDRASATNSYISIFDCASFFLQFALGDERTKSLTTTLFGRVGLARFTRMPFGLRSAPATAQRALDIIFDAAQCVGFIDDVALAHRAATLDAAVDELIECVAVRAKLFGVALNVDKMQLLKQSANFLGCTVHVGGKYEPPAGRMSALTDLPRPATVAGLRRFCQSAQHYSQYIPGFSILAAPLWAVCGRGQRLEWNDELVGHWTRLRDALAAAATAHRVVPGRPFAVTGDASQGGLAWAVYQEDPAAPTAPCKFIRAGGRRMRDYERTVPATATTPAHAGLTPFEGELLAIVEGIEAEQHLLFGSGSALKVYSDSKTLCDSMNAKTPFRDPAGRLIRQSLMVRCQALEAVWVHVPGRTHVLQDMVSRAWDADREAQALEAPEFRPQQQAAVLTLGTSASDEESSDMSDTAPVTPALDAERSAATESDAGPPSRPDAGANSERRPDPAASAHYEADAAQHRTDLADADFLDLLAEAYGPEPAPPDAPLHDQRRFADGQNQLYARQQQADAQLRDYWRHATKQWVDDAARDVYVPHAIKKMRPYVDGTGRLFVHDAHGRHRLAVPKSARANVMRANHQGVPTADAAGSTLARIVKRWWWPGVERDVKAFVRQCVSCQVREVRAPPPSLGTEPAVGRFETVHVDVIPMPPSTDGTSAILIMRDRASRYISVGAMRKRNGAECARVFRDEYLHRFGAPARVVPDCAGELVTSSEMRKAVAEYCGDGALDPVAPRNPQGNGLAESGVKMLKRAIGALLHGRPSTEWPTVLQAAAHSVNTSLAVGRTHSPWQLVYATDEHTPAERRDGMSHDEPGPTSVHHDARAARLQKAVLRAERERMQRLARDQHHMLSGQRAQLAFATGDVVLIANFAESEPTKFGNRLVRNQGPAIVMRPDPSGKQRYQLAWAATPTQPIVWRGVAANRRGTRWFPQRQLRLVAPGTLIDQELRTEGPDAAPLAPQWLGAGDTAALPLAERVRLASAAARDGDAEDDEQSRASSDSDSNDAADVRSDDDEARQQQPEAPIAVADEDSDDDDSESADPLPEPEPADDLIGAQAEAERIEVLREQHHPDGRRRLVVRIAGAAEAEEHTVLADDFPQLHEQVAQLKRTARSERRAQRSTPR